jgi:dihydrolipoamide dehydrogenase
VPWAIYCHPEVAWAGPGEDAAAEAGIDVVVGKHPFKFNSRAQILGETDGWSRSSLDVAMDAPAK